MIERLKRLWHLVVVIIEQFFANNGLVLAGALSFFTLISSIPLVFLIVSLVRWFLPESYLPILLEIMQNFVPEQMRGEVNQGVPVILNLKLGFSFTLLFQSLVSIGFLIWLGSLIFEIIEKILEVTFHVKSSRSFWRSKGVHIVQMLFLGGLYVMLSLVTWLVQVMAKSMQGALPGFYELVFGLGLFDIIGIVVNIFLPLLVFFVLYKTSTPKRLNNKSYFYGAAVAAFFWFVAKIGFGLYIATINDYSLFFGALAILARISVWVFYSAVIFIVGAEVAWLIERQTYELNETVETID